MFRPLYILTLSLAAGFIISACGMIGEDDLLDWDPSSNPFVQAWVGSENLKIKAPGTDASKAKLSAASQAVGEQAELYAFTYGVSTGVNNHIKMTLMTIDMILQWRPSKIEDDGDRLIWGPGSEPLEPFEFMFTVQKLEANRFEYFLQAKLKHPEGDQPTGFVNVVTGTIDKIAGPKESAGKMIWFSENLGIIDSLQKNATGKLIIDYDLTSDPYSIEVKFEDFRPGDAEDGAESLNAEYYYEQVFEGEGIFEFTFEADIIDTTSAVEELRIRSRWLPTGAGRADAAITGGDLDDFSWNGLEFGAITAESSQCWNEAFKTVYAIEHFSDGDTLDETNISENSDETLCAFETAYYPED